MSKKFSQFTNKSKSQINNATHFFSGYDSNLNENFRVNVEQLMPIYSDTGLGNSIVSNLYINEFAFKTISGSSGVAITDTGLELQIAVDGGSIDHADLTGIVPLANGGTGSALSDPGADRLLFWDDSAGVTTWLQIGSGLNITGTTITSTYSTPLLNKGDIFIHNGATDARLPIGSDGYFLKANSATSTGLEWAAISTVNDKVGIVSGGTTNYLGELSTNGILRTTNKLSYTYNIDHISLSVNEANIDLANCDNTTSEFTKEYDSGWIDINDYSISGGHGLYILANDPDPVQYRVIGRVVYFRGTVILPLNNGGIVTDASAYPSVTTSQIDVGSSGYSILSGQSIQSPALMADSRLYPDVTTKYSNRIVNRQFYINGTKVASLNSVVGVSFNSDGRLYISTIKDSETPAFGDVGYQWTGDLRRYLVSNVQSGDAFLDFASYETTFGNDTPTSGAYTYPFSCNATVPEQLGGFKIPLDGMFYHLTTSQTLENLHGLL